jgi:hypothetical protein
MKLAKKILGITMVLVIVLLLFALFVDQEFKIEKQVEINASQNEVFSYLKNLKNQDSFSKWGGEWTQTWTNPFTETMAL